MSTRNQPETGNRPQNHWFIREGTTGERIVDPDWKVFSDNAREFSWAPDPNTTRQDGLGIAYAVDHFNGSESHELTFNYDLQRPLVDASGNPDDPFYEVLVRDEFNRVQNTFALFSFDERAASKDDPSDTDGARTYSIGKGGYPNGNTEPEIEEGQPIPIEMELTFEKVRSYAMLQPATDTNIAVESTSSNDTTQSITFESKDGSATETLSLDGTNLVGGDTTFSDIFTFHLDGETEGDVHVYINDGDSTSPTKGTELTITPIRGSLHYSNDGQGLEGDLGVPAIGSGSKASALGTNYEFFQSADVSWGSTGALEPDIISFSAEGDNDYAQEPRNGTPRYRVVGQNNETQVTVEVLGPDTSHEHLERTLGNENHPLTFTLAKSKIDFNSASPVESGERARSASGETAAVETTFEPAGENAISVTNVE